MILIADSAIQLSCERIKELDIQVVEYPLFVNGEPYPVSMSMSRAEKDELRKIILDKKNKVTTAGLAEPHLLNMYASFKGKKILSFHQSLQMSSATASVLNKVKKELPDLDIELFDSHHMAAAYSVQLLEAAKAVKQGMAYDDLISLIKKNRENTRHLGVIYDLFFLHRTGRIGLVKAFMGSIMKIIPLVGSSDKPGVLISIGKARTFVKANQRFLRTIEGDMLAKRSKRLSVVMSYIGPHEKEVQHLKELIESKGWDASIEICYTNHSNMPHVGPDFYDVGYIVHTY